MKEHSPGFYVMIFYLLIILIAAELNIGIQLYFAGDEISSLCRSAGFAGADGNSYFYDNLKTEIADFESFVRLLEICFFVLILPVALGLFVVWKKRRSMLTNWSAHRKKRADQYTLAFSLTTLLFALLTVVCWMWWLSRELRGVFLDGSLLFTCYCLKTMFAFLTYRAAKNASTWKKQESGKLVFVLDVVITFLVLLLVTVSQAFEIAHA